MGRLRMGMVGGGEGAFIGQVHRDAAGLTGKIRWVAGALASDEQRARRSGRSLGLSTERSYGSWREMLLKEKALPAGERIDFVAIVVPNHLHFAIAKAFVEAGFAVVIDKPMVATSAQAQALADAARKAGVLVAVTYNYAGYPMVRQARHLVRSGHLGEVRRVVVEYEQGWLATPVETAGLKQAQWRTDPARAGLGGAIADIGTHAENLVATVTGLEIEAVCADLHAFGAGRALDDDANVLIRLNNGASGVLTVSQIAVGEDNNLTLRVYGSEGSLFWSQEQPDELRACFVDGSERTFRRGREGLCADAMRASRLPSGHPQGFVEAFSNLYSDIADALGHGEAGGSDGPFYASVGDGARGVRFVEAVVANSAGSDKWSRVR